MLQGGTLLVSSLNLSPICWQKRAFLLFNAPFAMTILALLVKQQNQTRAESSRMNTSINKRQILFLMLGYVAYRGI
jgi:hypothetical protein